MNRLLNLAILAAAFVMLFLYQTYATEPHSLRTGIAFVAFGYAVGTYGTMVGAGGGFLIVPALLLFYHATPSQAAGTGLSVVFLNAASGTLSYAQQKRIDYRAGLTFAVASLPGAVAGAYMSSAFSGHTFNIVFGVLLVAVSLVLLLRPAQYKSHAETESWEPRNWYFNNTLTDVEGHVFVYRYNWLIGAFLSFFVGFLSSVLGIGGGIIHVPVLVYILGFPPHLATATSHFILAITAGAGAATHLSLGHVLEWPALLMGVGAIGGAQIGALLGKRVQGTWLMRFLALALVAVALRLFMK